LLNTLSKIGLCSINELATSAQKNHSSIESDVIRLEELGLIERTEDGKISVPFESIEIFMPLAA
jgi:predicted transcriptional regulator